MISIAGLTAQAREHNLELSQPVVGQLLAYAKELELFSRGAALLSTKESSHLFPHIFDSLSLLPVFQEQGISFSSLADIGSGAGLPGIPLVIATGAKALLVERSQKKASILSSMTASLGLLGQVSILAADYRELKGQFDLIVSRALFPDIVSASSFLVSHLTCSGTLVFYQSEKQHESFNQGCLDSLKPECVTFWHKGPESSGKGFWLVRRRHI